MSKIRESLITNCEKKFLSKCLTDGRRLDERAFNEFRQLEIQFGQDWGLCYVSLGKTKVLAQTSCEIQTPKSSRPSEGILNVNIELNPLAAPHFEAGRQSEIAVQLNRLLEKCIKDSKAIDLESLCIKMKEKVWALRVDVNVLNHEGNILDCASIAMLTSLAHFRRPDVTCDGEEFIIHSYEQRDPIPTVIHHYPVCVTYSIFNTGEFILADPSLLEEGSADAFLTVALNGFRELCGLHLGGKAELMPDIILQVVSKAISRASIVIDQIKNSLKLDTEKREKKLPVGFYVEEIEKQVQVTEINKWKKVKSKKSEKDVNKSKNVKAENIKKIGKGSAEFIPNEDKNWIVINDDDDIEIFEQPIVQVNIVDSGSEEDDVIMLDSKT